MAKDTRKKIVEEAADIFFRLHETPDDAELIARRDAFLASGESQRVAYSQVAKSWAGSGRKPGPSKSLVLGMCLALGLAGFLLFEPVHNHLRADHKTRNQTQSIELASRDRAVLDARSMLADDTDGTVREVELLQGAAFFDVLGDGRTFVVQAGEVEIEVLGTAFEVTKDSGAVTVAVQKGRVRVQGEGVDRYLGAGDTVTVSQVSDSVIRQVDARAVASWREDRLVADSLTFHDVATIIERRLPGSIFIPDRQLSEARVSGVFHLNDPHKALAALAAVKDARIFLKTPFATLILPAD